ARSLLNKQDDQHQNDDLAEHRAGIGLQELVGDAERKGADERAPEIADSTEYHDHEGIDDVALAEIGTDIVDLRQRNTGEPGDAGAEAEGQGVDAAGADAHGSSHRAILGYRPHFEPEMRKAQERQQQ